MDGGLQHCTGGRDQDHPQEKEIWKGKMVVWGVLTNSFEKKRSKRQRRKGKIYSFQPIPQTCISKSPQLESKIMVHRHVTLHLSLHKTFPSHEHFRLPLFTSPSSRLEFLESSLVLLQEGVCYDQCTLLAKLCSPLPCFILYSKAKVACYSRCFLTSYFCIPVSFFGC